MNRSAIRRAEERDSNEEIKESDGDRIEKIKLDYENKIQRLKEKLDTQQLEINDNDKNIEILTNLYEAGIIDKDGRPL